MDSPMDCKGGIMQKSRIAGLVALTALGLSMTGCGNTKMRQENEQLKSQVLQLQKDNGELGNRIEEATAAQQSLTKENAQLRDENSTLKAHRPRTQIARRKHRQHRRTLPA
jgi:hypothetical protein